MTFDEAICAGKVTADEAATIFDSLVPVSEDFLIGTWKGSEFRSGHPNDGLLVSSGWFGKRFTDRDRVDPLLFYAANGEDFFPADPFRRGRALARGVTNITDVRSEVETSKPTARLRLIEFRGVVTTAMVYDQLAIIDYFRMVDDNTLLGAMDRRGVDSIYFFVLRRH